MVWVVIYLFIGSYECRVLAEDTNKFLTVCSINQIQIKKYQISFLKKCHRNVSISDLNSKKIDTLHYINKELK